MKKCRSFNFHVWEIVYQKLHKFFVRIEYVKLRQEIFNEKKWLEVLVKSNISTNKYNVPNL